MRQSSRTLSRMVIARIDLQNSRPPTRILQGHSPATALTFPNQHRALGRGASGRGGYVRRKQDLYGCNESPVVPYPMHYPRAMVVTVTVQRMTSLEDMCWGFLGLDKFKVRLRLTVQGSHRIAIDLSIVYWFWCIWMTFGFSCFFSFFSSCLCCKIFARRLVDTL